MISLLLVSITLPQITTELSGESTVLTVHGQTWQGQIDGIEDGSLRMRQSTGDGTAWLLWRHDEVMELKIAGRSLRGPLAELLEADSPEQLDAGLKGLDLYWQSRLPYLDWLGLDELMFLSSMTPAYLQQGRLWETVAFGKLLETRLRGKAPEAEETLRRMMLEGLFKFNFIGTAQERASDYLRHQIGFCGFALPWYILALQEMEQESYNKALDLLWFPLLLRQEPGLDWIEECITLAKTIALRLKDDRLLHELEALSAVDNSIHSPL